MSHTSRRPLGSEIGATLLEYLWILSGLNCALLVAVSVLGPRSAQPYFAAAIAIGGPEALELLDNGDGGGSQSTQQGTDEDGPELPNSQSSGGD